jgi:DNA mismatch repair protein MutS
MMRQYEEIKAQYPDVLLFFRLGDFYEMFGEDAQLASRELGIALTGRDAGMPERIPMCGVPHHAVDQYLEKLVQKGYRVAICEQMEDPKSVKGIVKRSIVRVVTSGTMMDAESGEQNQYLAALFEEDGRIGFALCEAALGELYAAQYEGEKGRDQLRDELLRLKPRELLIPVRRGGGTGDGGGAGDGTSGGTRDGAAGEASGGTGDGAESGAAGEAENGARDETGDGAAGGAASGDSWERRFFDALSLREETALTPVALSMFDPAPNLDRIAQLSHDRQNAPPDAGRIASANSAPEDSWWKDWPLALRSAAALLFYLEDTQKMEPRQILSIRLLRSQEDLIIDATTFRNLEIVRGSRTYDKKGSLYELLDETRTAAGSRCLRQWLEKPLTDLGQIEARLDAVEQIKDDWTQRQALRKLMDSVHDLDRLMTRVVYRRALPRELLALKSSLAVLPGIISHVQALNREKPVAEWTAILEETDPLDDLHDLLQIALTDPAPPGLKEPGVIRTGYHAQVDEYRESAKNGRDWMTALETEERKKTGVKSLKIGFNKVFGYYFEVTKSNLALVPDYYQRKQTLAGGERFVSEELIRLENLVLGAEDKLLELEESLYQDLLTQVGLTLPRARRTSRALARLDAFQALGETAVKRRYCRPVMLEQQTQVLRFTDLRHPVVEEILDSPGFVPNDLDMDPDSRLFVITGPNMGGKSTYCRSAALAVIMAQMGSFVPASQARIAIRDRVFARVGASDDLRSGQSTFMVEMNEVAHILRHATPFSLVILDEVGRGTGTYDGMSVAWAVSEYLAGVLGAKTLFATHYLELTQLAEKIPQIKNLSLTVREEGEQIVFLHKILPGAADRSYGVHVARLAGLPGAVIEQAYLILKDLENTGGGKSPAAANRRLIPPPAGDRREEDRREEGTRPAPDQPEPLPAAPDQPAPDQPESLPAEARPGQLSLFGDPPPKSAKASKGKGDVVQMLLSADLMNLTPLEAMNFLFALQQKARNDKI